MDMDSVPWSGLTRIDIKAKLYERETYFREGLADARMMLGEGFTDLVRRAALLMVKPDGLMAGKAAQIVDYIERNGFSIVAFETPTLQRFHWRELWRFQLTSATLDRLAVNDLVFKRPSLVLMLRYQGELDIPATVHLSVLKGVSDIALQAPHCLRRLIGQPNRIFSFFHVADEPADLLREVVILLDTPQRQKLLAALALPTLAPAEQRRLAEITAASVAQSRDLDASAAVRRLLTQVRHALLSAVQDDLKPLTYLEVELTRMERGDRIAWQPFARALRSSRLAVDEWDVATVATNFIIYDEPGHSKQIVGVDPASWRSAY
jgi:hypothetical protein